MASAAVREVRIPAGAVELEGELVLPDSAAGVVLFAHGSGSSRHSPRNRFVADVRQARTLAGVDQFRESVLLSFNFGDVRV